MRRQNPTWEPGPIDTPLKLYTVTVRPEWIDLNGHMSVSAYAQVFSAAGDAFLDYLGVSYAHKERTNRGSFGLHWNMSFLREIPGQAALHFTTRLLDHNAKLIHYLISMHHGDEGYLAATSEHLDVHVDLATRRSTPMPDTLQRHLADLKTAHAVLPGPPQAGVAIGIRRAQTD